MHGYAHRQILQRTSLVGWLRRCIAATRIDEWIKLPFGAMVVLYESQIVLSAVRNKLWAENTICWHSWHLAIISNGV